MICEQLLAKLQDLPRVVAHSCTALFNLAQSFRTPDPDESSLLSTPMVPLLQALLQTAERPDADEHNLRTSSLSAAAELVNTAPMDTVQMFSELLPAILTKLETGLNLTTDNEAQAQLVGGLMSYKPCVDACLLPKLNPTAIVS